MKTLFENNYYLVQIDADATKYLVINKDTLIIELETSILPEAINMAKLFENSLSEYWSIDAQNSSLN